MAKKNLPFLLLLLLGLIWGSSFILIKLGLQSFSAMQLALIRLSIAGLVFTPFIKKHLKFVKKEDVKYFILAGFLGNGIPAYLFALAEVKISSSLAGSLNSLTPLFTLIIGLIVGGVLYSHKKLLGVLIGCVGAIVLLFSGLEETTNSNYEYGLLVVIGAACYGANINLINTKLINYKPLTISMMPLFFIAILSMVGLFFTDINTHIIHYTPAVGQSFLAIIVLAVFGNSISLTLFNRLIQLTTPVYASLVTYIIPIVATFIGFLAGESIGIYHIIGLLAIIVGIRLVNR